MLIYVYLGFGNRVNNAAHTGRRKDKEQHLFYSILLDLFAV